jgi:hypothetical protein
MMDRDTRVLQGAGLDRLVLAEPDTCRGAGCGDCAGCWERDAAEDDRDPDLTAGVDPRTGYPLEQSGVNVRLAP